jgi:flagella basal body P-ring formation protein FlgA
MKMVKLTKEQALKIQAEQVAFYSRHCPNLDELVAAATTADQLEPGIEYDVVVINRHIPRGGKIEQLAGLGDLGEA